MILINIQGTYSNIYYQVFRCWQHTHQMGMIVTMNGSWGAEADAEECEVRWPILRRDEVADVESL